MKKRQIFNNFKGYSNPYEASPDAKFPTPTSLNIHSFSKMHERYFLNKLKKMEFAINNQVETMIILASKVIDKHAKIMQRDMSINVSDYRELLLDAMIEAIKESKIADEIEFLKSELN